MISFLRGYCITIKANYIYCIVSYAQCPYSHIFILKRIQHDCIILNQLQTTIYYNILQTIQHL